VTISVFKNKSSFSPIDVSLYNRGLENEEKWKKISYKLSIYGTVTIIKRHIYIMRHETMNYFSKPRICNLAVLAHDVYSTLALALPKPD
jgi:hypothetical protein